MELHVDLVCGISWGEGMNTVVRVNSFRVLTSFLSVFFADVFHYVHFEIDSDPRNLIGSQQCDYVHE